MDLPPHENPLLTNKSFAAQLRDEEAAIVRDKIRPVHLRDIPREQWDRYLDFHLTLPPKMAEAIEPGPLPTDVAEAFEDAVAAYHGVTAPYYVDATFTLRDHGRAWRYVEEAGEYLTGFVLGKEEA